MKAATGELSLTVITIVAIGAIAAVFALLWPTMKNKISSGWTNVDSNTNYNTSIK